MANEAELLNQLRILEESVAQDERKLASSRKMVNEAVDFLFPTARQGEALRPAIGLRSFLHPTRVEPKQTLPRKSDLQFGTVFLRTVGLDYAVVGVPVKNVSGNKFVSDVSGSLRSSVETVGTSECRSYLVDVNETNGMVMSHSGPLHPDSSAYLMLKFPHVISDDDFVVICVWSTLDSPNSVEGTQQSRECGRFNFASTPNSHISDGLTGDDQAVTMLVAAVSQERISFGLLFNQMSKVSCLSRIKNHLTAAATQLDYVEKLKSFVTTATGYEGCRVQVYPISNVKAKIFVFAWSELQLKRFLEKFVMPVISSLDDIQLLPISAFSISSADHSVRLRQLDTEYERLVEAVLKLGDVCDGDKYRQLRSEMLRNSVSYNEVLLGDS